MFFFLNLFSHLLVFSFIYVLKMIYIYIYIDSTIFRNEVIWVQIYNKSTIHCHLLFVRKTVGIIFRMFPCLQLQSILFVNAAWFDFQSKIKSIWVWACTIYSYASTKMTDISMFFSRWKSDGLHHVT